MRSANPGKSKYRGRSRPEVERIRFALSFHRGRLILDSPIAQGSPLAFTLTLPPEITLTESIRVQCKGRVVRVEESANEGKMAVAAVIEDYEFLPES